MGEPKKVTTAILDLANARDVEGMDRYLADDIKFVNPVTGPTDKNGMAGFHTALFAAFPDIHYRVDREIEHGDTAIFEATVTGTNTGPFMGQAPTGRKVELPVAFVVDVAGGKAKVWHAYLDAATLQRQLAGETAAPRAATA